jgi:adhesin/invasin
VTFTTEAGEGAVSAETVSTDRAGRARAAWTLGPHPGRQRLLASVDGVDTTVAVTAEADPVPGKTRVQLSGETPSGPVGVPLAEPATIRVTDAAGAAAADVSVTWTALDGGKIEALDARTDSLGEARASWTLGPRAGTQRARVQIGNPRTMPPFTVSATARAEAPAAVALVSGGNQEGRVGAPLKGPVVVRVTDRNGNPVRGGVVRVSALGGSVPDSAPVADAQGRVEIRWTLGTKTGAQSLELAPDSGPAIRVTARALPREPANIAAGTVPPSSTAGRALAKPITVTVTDAYGNIIPNVQVAFSVSAGSAAPLRVMTDARGQAATRWTLGSAAREQSLTAAVKGTPAKMTLAILATRPGASRPAPPRPASGKAAPKK